MIVLVLNSLRNENGVVVSHPWRLTSRSGGLDRSKLCKFGSRTLFVLAFLDHGVSLLGTHAIQHCSHGTLLLIRRVAACTRKGLQTLKSVVEDGLTLFDLLR